MLIYGLNKQMVHYSQFAITTRHWPLTAHYSPLTNLQLHQKTDERYADSQQDHDHLPQVEFMPLARFEQDGSRDMQKYPDHHAHNAVKVMLQVENASTT